MKQSMISISAALATILLASPICNAIPTSGDVTNIVARDDAITVSTLYGNSGRPQEDDLVQARIYKQSNMNTLIFERYISMLYAFRKCSINWPESWFPNQEELQNLTKSKPMKGDAAYFLRYSQDDQKRHPVAVSSGWIDNNSITEELQPSPGAPWWPWAALQAASEDKLEDMSLEDAILAISGERLVFNDLTNKEDYWSMFQKSDFTPMLVRWLNSTEDSISPSGWYILTSPTGESPEDGSVSLGYVDQQGFKKMTKVFWAMREHIGGIFYLDGFPSFSGRKGEIQY